MVSEALDIPQQDDMPEDENSQFDVVDEGGRSQPPSTPFTFGNRTIVAADNEVSNGFVKSGTGKSLPYVFEANESGKWIYFLEPWCEFDLKIMYLVVRCLMKP